MLVAVGGYKTPDRERNGYCVLVDRHTRCRQGDCLIRSFRGAPWALLLRTMPSSCPRAGTIASLRCPSPPGMNALASKLRPMK